MSEVNNTPNDYQCRFSSLNELHRVVRSCFPDGPLPTNPVIVTDLLMDIASATTEEELKSVGDRIAHLKAQGCFDRKGLERLKSDYVSRQQVITGDG